MVAKRRGSCGILHNWQIRVKLEEKCYRIIVRPLNIWKDSIGNEATCEMVGVEPIEDKLKEDRVDELGWFGHAQGRPLDAMANNNDKITINRNVGGWEDLNWHEMF